MSDVRVCPDPDSLRQLMLGQLGDADADRLERHVEHCAACVQTLHTLRVHDTLVEAVRAQSAAPAGGPPDAVRDLIRRMQSMSAPADAAQEETRTGLVGAAPSPGEVPATPGAVAVGADIQAFLARVQGPDGAVQLGPYRVQELLGCGGMGMVFRAEDVALHRLVAVKMIHPVLAA